MKISYSWLKDYIKINEKVDDLSKVLTGIGLEIEGIESYESVKNGLKDFVIGEVLTCEKHPNADRLSLTTVNVGNNEILPIVCGAPNVAAGQKVVVAKVGCEVGSGDKIFKIEKAKIRGEVSEGMICAEDEIGLGDSHDGIMVLSAGAKPGMPAAEYFNVVKDTVFEIGLTPNRIDSASHFGTARDLYAFYSQKKDIDLIKPDISDFKVDNESNPVEVIIEDRDGCKRYCGVTISGVTIGPSPDWMQNRLKAIGLNPINNVVDITNYVLHETGQPLHAFDSDKLVGKKIIVKKYPEGTKFMTLDEEERKLSAYDTMISDAENPVCIAGVLGGLDSGVTDSTKNIFLECAYFNPVAVRKTAKRHTINTDSSFRFERGVDPNNTLYTLKRTALLIKQIAGGKISSQVVDVYPEEIKSCIVKVDYKHVDRLIGKIIPRDEIRAILNSLEIKIIEEKNDTLSLEIPTYRVDVTREADVIEEILRIYGYNNIETGTSLKSILSITAKPNREKLVNIVSDYLTSNGFNEIMSNSITKSVYYRQLNTFPEKKLVKLHNPLSSDLDVMRQTILFSGLEAITHNINRQRYNLKLYEYGNVYSLQEGDEKKEPLSIYHEEPHIGIFITGNKFQPNWSVKEQKSSFHQLKAFYENILIRLGISPEELIIDSLEKYKDIYSGGIRYLNHEKQEVVLAGVIDEKLCLSFDIEQEVFYADFNWTVAEKMTLKNKIQYKELPKFPEVRRDFALLLDNTVEYSEIENEIKKLKIDALNRINLFDYYKGKGIPEGKKSYGISFYLQDLTKTLTDTEIERIMSKFQELLTGKFHAELR